jgi:5'-nucleotidase
MLILLTNDDGISALGIQELRLAFEPLARVFLVAPDRERSATGHGITMHKPLRVEKKCFGNKSTGYAVSGTPADCVKLALEKLLPERPNLVISGINRGSNLGTDVLYSGTVSAALEAIINGIPSVAISLDFDVLGNFKTAADFATRLAILMLEHPIPQNTLLNVNIPDLKKDEIRGVKATKLGLRRYVNSVEERTDPRGREYYWLGGNIEDISEDDTDLSAVRQQYISITPLHYDLTNYSVIQQIKDWEMKLTP